MESLECFYARLACQILLSGLLICSVGGKNFEVSRGVWLALLVRIKERRQAGGVPRSFRRAQAYGGHSTGVFYLCTLL